MLKPLVKADQRTNGTRLLNVIILEPVQKQSLCPYYTELELEINTT